MQGSHVDFENLFHTTETNIDTLKHLMLRELDAYHNYLDNADCKDGLSWWCTK